MGTKNNPGKFDCYSKLEPDEPHFVIMGRDPSAALLIGLWAMLRELQLSCVDTSNEDEKIEEARECADACLEWARKLGKEEALEKVNEAWRAFLKLQER